MIDPEFQSFITPYRLVEMEFMKIAYISLRIEKEMKRNRIKSMKCGIKCRPRRYKCLLKNKDDVYDGKSKKNLMQPPLWLLCIRN